MGKMLKGRGLTLFATSLYENLATEGLIATVPQNEDGNHRTACSSQNGLAARFVARSLELPISLPIPNTLPRSASKAPSPSAHQPHTIVLVGKTVKHTPRRASAGQTLIDGIHSIADDVVVRLAELCSLLITASFHGKGRGATTRRVWGRLVWKSAKG